MDEFEIAIRRAFECLFEPIAPAASTRDDYNGEPRELQVIRGDDARPVIAPRRDFVERLVND